MGGGLGLEEGELVGQQQTDGAGADDEDVGVEGGREKRWWGHGEWGTGGSELDEGDLRKTTSKREEDRYKWVSQA